MQIQKEEVRQSILNAALNEFQTQGYINASMKNIALRAGVAVGNIYRYFKSKEVLFEEVVKPAWDQLVHEIHHHDHPDMLSDDITAQQRLIDDQVNRFIRLIVDHHDALIVLTDHSAGTKYANAKAQLLDQIYSHIMTELNEMGSSLNINITGPYIHAFCVAMIEGALDLGRNHESEEDLRNDFRDFINDIFYGILSKLKLNN